MIGTEQAKQRALANDWRPRNCVWELTLACNLRCGHCGSRAGKPRPGELSTTECLDVVGQLAELGCELVTLSGGEPTIRRDWDVIARAIADRGMKVNMVTNGAFRDEAATRAIARRAKDAGLCNIGISIDGPEEVHDGIRGAGTFARTIASVRTFRAEGLPVGVLTTVTRQNLHLLPEIKRLVQEAGATLWRLQLGKPMGSLCEHRDLVLRPEQMLVLVPMIARLKKEGGLHVAIGDSIGYYGPYDELLRGRGWRGRKECWKGCQAGMQAIGIEADGGVKGCLSLQAKWGDRDPFVEGNLRERRLSALWHDPRSFAFNRAFSVDQLTGVCVGCPKGQLCRGGARCVSSATLGVVTEDPWCWFRLDRERRAHQPSAWAQAAAVAAALALSVGSAAGCGSNGGGGDDDDTSVMPDYGVEPYDASPGDDAGLDAGPDSSVSTDYGVDPYDAGVDASAGPEYGIFPEPDAGVDPCANACCECDYGEPPPPECCPR
jgi:radical SAM protein with 4Fe4S-binding SPASM domain